jgi:hypothetical protein
MCCANPAQCPNWCLTLGARPDPSCLLVHGPPIPAIWREPGSPVTSHWKVSLEVGDDSLTLSDGKPRRTRAAPPICSPWTPQRVVPWAGADEGLWCREPARTRRLRRWRVACARQFPTARSRTAANSGHFFFSSLRTYSLFWCARRCCSLPILLSSLAASVPGSGGRGVSGSDAVRCLRIRGTWGGRPGSRGAGRISPILWPCR